MSKFKQRSHETYERHLKFLEEDKSNFDYVLIGTSMFERMEWEEEAKQKFKEHLKDKSILNLGCGGDKICNILYRLEDGKILDILKNRDIKKVVFMAGANDMEFGNPKTVSTDKDKRKLEELANLYFDTVELIKKYLPETEINLMGIFPRTSQKFSDETMLNRVKEFNELTKSPKYLNYYFGDQLLKDNKCNEEMFFDYVHFNNKGYDVLCRGLKLIIES